MTTAAADQPQQRDAAPDQRAKTEEEKIQDVFQAIFSGSVDSVNTKVRSDPQLVLMDLKGMFAVHLACNEGKIGVLETLFKHSSKEVLLELPDPEKNTPLLAAVKGEQVDMVRYLVGQGADKNAADQSERTAVHMAVASNNVEMLRQLRDLRFDINKKDMLQQSAIFDAIVSGNEEMIAAVMDWPEIDVAYQDSIGFTPFCIACRRGNLSAVSRILEMAPDQLNRPKQDGCTGLHMAALNNHKDVVHCLLQQTGIEIDAVTATEQRTALHMACHEGYTSIAKLLIDNGARKNAVDSSGKTCLHLCFEVPPEKVNDPEKSDESIQRLAEYLLQSDVPHLVKDGDGKLAEDCVKSGLKLAVTELIKKWGQTQEKQEQKKPDGGRGDRRGSDPGSKVPSGTPEPPKVSKSVRAPRANEPTPRITDMQGSKIMSGGKFGANWTAMIYFYPRADDMINEVHPISDNELMQKISELTDADEDIQEVSVYEGKLVKYQLTKLVLYHTFVVLRTELWYWSIEKNSEGIVLQRSKYENAVRDKLKGKDRPQWRNLKHVEQDAGKKSIKELVRMLYLQNELKKTYLTSNCKHFVQTVFNFTAKSKKIDRW